MAIVFGNTIPVSWALRQFGSECPINFSLARCPNKLKLIGHCAWLRSMRARRPRSHYADLHRLGLRGNFKKGNRTPRTNT